MNIFFSFFKKWYANRFGSTIIVSKCNAKEKVLGDCTIKNLNNMTFYKTIESLYCAFVFNWNIFSWIRWLFKNIYRILEKVNTKVLLNEPSIM